jgi:hypothetical protein
MDEKNDDLARIDTLFQKQDNFLKKTWLKNERLYNSKHDPKLEAKLKKKRRSNLFIPTIRNTTNIIKAIFSTAFFSSGNPIELKPLGEDESDIWTYRNKVLEYYFNKLKPNKELSKAFLSSLIYRMGVVITLWDDRKKKVVTTFIPVTDIAFDDECVNIDDVQELAYRYYESNRVITQKINSKVYNEKGIKKRLFNEENSRTTKRRLVKVLYTQTNKGYISKTFVDGVLVRIAKLKNCPFQYGYCLEKLPSIDSDIRKDEILCYGGDICELLEQLQKEINQKRNNKTDVQEKNLNPDVFVGDQANLNVNDLSYGHGKAIKYSGDIKQVKERQTPMDYSIDSDLNILAGDVQSASGVNSIQGGETGASDRRSATALAVVNSNSSMRIEEMILLIKETLFEHWAKTWVKIVFKNADDEVINAITGEEYPLGKKGSRNDFEFDLSINFGMTLDKEKRINDLLQIYQMTSQNPNINPKIIEGFLKKILDLRIGEDTDLTNLYKEAEKEVNNKPLSKEEQEKENLKKGGLV